MKKETAEILESRLDIDKAHYDSCIFRRFPPLSQETRVGMVALLAGSQHITNLFGKSMKEIGGEYKVKDGDTPRTLIDTCSEQEILSVIKSFPEFDNDSINAEESGESGKGTRAWYIDPYDGTSNAQIKLPMSTSGIGISKKGELVSSIILNPFEKKLFYAEKGRGAHFSDLEINSPYLKDSLFIAETVTGEDLYGWHSVYLSTDRTSDKAATRYAWVDALFNKKTTLRKNKWVEEMMNAGLIQNVRMTGSNIDYSAKIAEGRGHYQLTDAVGGYFDLCGYNLVEEAGGRMVNLEGKQPMPGDQVAVAVANPKDLEQVLEITRKCYSGYEGFK